MSWAAFAIMLATCCIVIAACRIVPVFALKGRELPARAAHALSLIPCATFAALIANDLLSPGMFADGLWPAALPLVASAVVALVGLRSASLVACILAGVAAYALMLLL